MKTLLIDESQLATLLRAAAGLESLEKSLSLTGRESIRIICPGTLRQGGKGQMDIRVYSIKPGKIQSGPFQKSENLSPMTQEVF